VANENEKPIDTRTDTCLAWYSTPFLTHLAADSPEPRTIGGYQVLKKWLSYRERQVLGRDITKDEAREFTHIVRRIAALLLLEPELDKNYRAAKIKTHPYKAASAAPAAK
jgi:hypothetical protein